MNLELRLKEIKARVEEIRGLVDSETDVEKLSAYDKEVDELTNERKAIEKKLAMRGKFEVKDVIETKSTEETAEMEARGQALLPSLPMEFYSLSMSMTKSHHIHLEKFPH